MTTASNNDHYQVDARVTTIALAAPERAHLLAALERDLNERYEARKAAAEAEAAQKAAPKAAPAFEIAAPFLWGEGPIIRLIERESLISAHQRTVNFGSVDKRDRDSVIAALKRVAQRGLDRRIGIAVEIDESLRALRVKHPNFIAVIDAIETERALAGCTGLPLHLPPMLLDGPPGCGKTFFAQHLADALGSGFVRVSMETAQSAADLTGSAEYWGNSKPGRLFHQLIEHDYANPVVLIDEVDKAGGHDSHRSDRSLYQLLDPGTARVWADQSYPTLQIDASHVIWILTSNNHALIEAPLLSRMQLFTIEALDKDTQMQMIRNIFVDVIEGLQLAGFEADIPTAILHALLPHSLREVSRWCRQLIARAVRGGRLHLVPSDLAAIKANTKGGPRPIGF